MTIPEYLRRIEAALRQGNATEHTHRAALAELVDGLAPDVTATNEPRRSAFGAIDYVVSRDTPSGSLPLGYIEAKDVGADLSRVERSEQLSRYRDALSNLILTDYLEFRWYLDGDLRARASLGAADRSGKVRPDKAGAEEVRNLLTGFLAQAPPPISNPRELAQRLAGLTHLLRDDVLKALRGEDVAGNLHAQLEAFRRTLIPDLEPEQFADMYAQTVAYGLFAARASEPARGGFTRDLAPRLLPRTNPFLRQFFREIATLDELDERVAWIVDALAALLAAADMEGILRDFGRRTRQEDPVVHFYETFLATYDPRTREMRGVYYTPEPVVSYLVRSVDRLLRGPLGSPGGLAGPRTFILDPAVGTGTFLYAVVNEIHERFVREEGQGAWPSYVGEKLLGRVFGFELLMAPYTVAHLKLGLLLQQTGYDARGSGARLGVYLTNTLAEGVDVPPLPFAGYISDEANAATDVKRDRPIIVVLGNPPYSGHSANDSKALPWIGGLVRDYYRVDGRPLGERNPKWLQDDYVKFIRFGQWRIDETGEGILAYISNNGYLDNPTFRGMRQSLMASFSRIHILDLHGNARKRERAPGGGPDENVFDIQQGVAIALFVKERGVAGPAKVYHADLWGEREAKYRTLCDLDVDTTEWTELQPQTPNYLFVPQDVNLRVEYDQGWKLTDILPFNNTGIITARDKFVLSFDKQLLINRIGRLRSPATEQQVVDEYSLTDTREIPLTRSLEMLREMDNPDEHVQPVSYRPFDTRWLFYHQSLVRWPVMQAMYHMLVGQNLACVTTRQTRDEWGVLALNHIMGHKALAAYDVNYMFPLYLYPPAGKATYKRSDAIEAARKAIRAREGLGARELSERLNEVAELVRRLYPREEYARWPNLAPGFLADVEASTGLRYTPEAEGPAAPSGGTSPDPGDTFTPEDIFYYMYALLHSPTYRERYAPFLKSDFPRVPLTGDPDLFRDLAALGGRLVALHLLRAPELADHGIAYPVQGGNEVERVSYDPAEGGRVWINKT